MDAFGSWFGRLISFVERGFDTLLPRRAVLVADSAPLGVPAVISRVLGLIEMLGILLELLLPDGLASALATTVIARRGNVQIRSIAFAAGDVAAHQ